MRHPGFWMTACLTLLATLVIQTGAFAVAPSNIVSYQGRLLDASGVPVTSASATMIFRLYDDVAAGNCLWSNSSATCASATGRSVTLTDGLFSENIGDTGSSYAAIADTVFSDNAAVYLSISVNGELLTPRKLLTAAPYALNAQALDGLSSSGFLQTTLPASSSVGFGASTYNLTFTNNGSGNEVHNLSSTGDLVIQDNGTPIATFADTGAITFAGTSGQAITFGTTAANLILQTTTSGDITATTGAAAGLFNVLTGNLKIGNGTPGVAQDGEDAYIEGTLEVDGASQFDGTVTVSDLVCTDCLDFAEFADALTLDTSTSIGFGAGALALTFTNNGSGNEVHNLSSTGDLVIQDNGSAFATFTDGGSVTFSMNAGNQFLVSAPVFPTVDVMEVSSVGIPSQTDGVDGLQVTFGSSNASGSSLRLVPSFSGGATDARTFSAIGIDAFGAANAAGTDTVNGVSVGTLTDPGATITSSAFAVGTGWDTIFSGSTANTSLFDFTNFDVTSAGAVTATDYVCTDCLDFDSLEDTLDLDAPTDIQLGGSTYNLTFVNNGSGNEVHNLSSTGDLVIEDNGTPFVTFGDNSTTTFMLPATAQIEINASSTPHTSNSPLEINFASNGSGLDSAQTIGVSSGGMALAGDQLVGTFVSLSANATDVTDSAIAGHIVTYSSAGDTDAGVVGFEFVAGDVPGLATTYQGAGNVSGARFSVEAEPSTNGVGNLYGLQTYVGNPDPLVTYSGSLTSAYFGITSLSSSSNVKGLTVENSDTARAGDYGAEIKGDWDYGLVIGDTGAAIANGLYFWGATVDITANVGEDLVIQPGSGGAGNLVLNLPNTGDLQIQDNGTPFVTFNDSSSTTFTLPATAQVLIDASSTAHTSNAPLGITYAGNGSGYDSASSFTLTSSGMTGGSADALFGTFVTLVSNASDAADSGLSGHIVLYDSAADTSANVAGYEVVASDGAGAFAETYVGDGRLSAYRSNLKYDANAPNVGNIYGSEFYLYDVSTGGDYVQNIFGSRTYIGDIADAASVVSGSSVVNAAAIAGDFGYSVEGDWGIGLRVGTSGDVIDNGLYFQGATVDITAAAGEDLILQPNSGGAGNLVLNLPNTGDLEVRDNGTAFFTLDDEGNATYAGRGNQQFALTSGLDVVSRDTALFSVTQADGGLSNNNMTGDNALAVITSSDTGSVGDLLYLRSENAGGYILRADDVSGDTSPIVIDDMGNLLIGGTAESLSNASFTLAGEDLYVAGLFGVEGNTFFDGVMTLAGVAEGTSVLTLTAGDLVITDGDITLSSGQFEIPDNTSNAFTLEDGTSGADYLNITTTDGSETMVFGHSTVDSLTFTTDNNAAGDFAITGGLTLTSAGTHNSFTITSSADTEHAQVITANSLTTGDAINITSTATTGSGIDITDSTGDTASADGAVFIKNTDGTLTAQQYLIQGRYTDSDDAFGDFLLFEDNGGTDQFVIGQDGDVVITGSADGTDALTLTAGDILVSNGDLDLSGGDFNVTLDAADEVDITKTATAAATEEGLDLTFTAGAGDGSDIYSVLRIAGTSANHSASTDKLYGINILAIASADAQGDEVAVNIGQGWDAAFRLQAASSFTQTTSLTGIVLDYNTNYTPAVGTNIVVADINFPATFDFASAGTEVYTGLDMTTVGTYTRSNGAGVQTLTYKGIDITTPDLAWSSGSNSASATAINVTLGQSDPPSSGDAQVGLKINGTAGSVSGGVITGVDMANITSSGATETGIIIGTGWDLAMNAEGAIEIDFDTTNDNTIGVCKNSTDGTADSQFRECNGTPGDIAEWYPTDAAIGPGYLVATTDVTIDFTSDQVDPATGMVVGYGTASHTVSVLTKTPNPYASGMLGIISSSPVQTFGKSVRDVAANSAPVALIGRVPAYVNAEGGAIAAGDMITASSTAGVGMKATQAGPTVGYALNAWAGPGQGMIEVFVSPSWYGGSAIEDDGTIFANSYSFDSLGTATVGDTGKGSHTLSFRGSGWNGTSAEQVGMGIKLAATDATAYRLSFTNKTDTEVAYVTGTGDLVLSGKLYPSDRGVAQTDKYIYYDGSAGPGGDFMRTNASGWSTGSYDFAEMFPSTQGLAPGELVVASTAGDKEHVERSTSSYQKALLGIVSTKPGFLAGDNKEGHFPIALKGRVPTLVNNENGPIAVGDPLTSSSTPGYAMKAVKAGPVVGYALEPFTGAQGSLIAFVSLGWWEPDAVVAPVTETTSGVANTASQMPVGSSSSSLNLESGLFLAGSDILGVRRIAGIADRWSIEEDGTVKTEASYKAIITSLQNEKVETYATLNREQKVTISGTGRLVNGASSIRFEDVDQKFNDITSTTAPVRVFVTLRGPANGMYVAQADHNGFDVRELANGTSTVDFDWYVEGYRLGQEPATMLPAPTEPIVTEPTVVDSPVPEPVVTEPTPVTTDPVSLPTEPIVAEPVVAEPTVSEPVVTEPVAEPVVWEPAPVEPVLVP